MFHYFSDDNLSERDGTSATISTLTWFLFHLLSFICIIPFIGPIIWLVVYLVLGLRQDTAPSIRNLIRLQIIFAIIGIIIGVLIIIASAGVITSIAELFKEGGNVLHV